MNYLLRKIVGCLSLGAGPKRFGDHRWSTLPKGTILQTFWGATWIFLEIVDARSKDAPYRQLCKFMVLHDPTTRIYNEYPVVSLDEDRIDAALFTVVKESCE